MGREGSGVCQQRLRKQSNGQEVSFRGISYVWWCLCILVFAESAMCNTFNNIGRPSRTSRHRKGYIGFVESLAFYVAWCWDVMRSGVRWQWRCTGACTEGYHQLQLQAHRRKIIFFRELVGRKKKIGIHVASPFHRARFYKGNIAVIVWAPR